MSVSNNKLLPVFLIGAMVVLALLGAGSLLVAKSILVFDPIELDYGEGILLWQMAHVTDLHAAFHPITQYPFIVFHYTPLYHLAARFVDLFLGNLLAAGRLVSLLSTVWILLVTGWIVYCASPRRFPRAARLTAALVAPAIAFQMPVMTWVPYARVDMLALALSITGSALVALYPRNIKRLTLAFLLFLLALYTKQTQICAPIIAFFVIMLWRPRIAFALGSGLAAAGLLILAGLHAVTGGESTRHLLLYNQNPFSIQRAREAMLTNIGGITLLLILSLGPVFHLLLTHPVSSAWSRLRARLNASRYYRTILLFTLLSLTAFCFSFTSGKEGSNINYFMEWNLMLCPLAGLLLARLLATWRLHSPPTAALSTGLLTFLFLLGTQLNDSARYLNFIAGISAGARQVRRENLAQQNELVTTLAAIPGPVVSEQMTALVQAGKEIPLEPAIVQVLSDAKLWDESELVRMTRSHRFGAFVLWRDPFRFTSAMRQAIDEAYQPTQNIGPWVVYRPR